MIKIAAALGDYYHQSNYAKESLEQSISQYVTEANVETNYYSHEQLPEALGKNPDLVILFKENRLNPSDEAVTTWMTEKMEEIIAAYVGEGGAWLAWHSGLASYPSEGVYSNMLKGRFVHHPEEHQVVSYKTTPQYFREPVSFKIVDEHYFVQCEEEETAVFLTSESVDGKDAAGWHHFYEKGKVCCLTPAHNKEGLMDPGFLRVLGDCLNWLIRRQEEKDEE